MKTLTSMFVLAAATLLVASPALAQKTTPSGDAAQKGGAGSQSPSATSPGTTGSDAKSDGMKSDSMKSDTMKSGGAKAAGAGGQERVRKVQEALKDKGMDPGPVDGIMGPKTQSALRDFQKQEGMEETGRLDAETMSKLGVASAGAGSPPAASPRGDSGTTGGGATTPPSGSTPGTKK
jgi:peptidoglycan hydrolase-like protein with peptidoglycan-binding domain